MTKNGFISHKSQIIPFHLRDCILLYCLTNKILTKEVTKLIMQNVLEEFQIPSKVAANFPRECFDESFWNAPANLKKLSLRGCNQLEPNQLIKLIEYYPLIEELDLSYVPKLLGEEIRICTKNLKNLKKLKVERLLQVKKMKIESSSLEYLICCVSSNMEHLELQNTSNLKLLDLRECICLKKISVDKESVCKSLEEVVIDGCESLVELENFFESIPENSLKKINFWDIKKLDKKHFELFFNKFTNLEELILTCCKIQDEDIVPLIDSPSTKTIKTLCLNGCESLGNQMVRELVCKCHNLNVLRIPLSLYDKDCDSISQNCLYLDSVDLSFMPKLTHHSVVSFLTHCKKLRWISLVDLHFTENFHQKFLFDTPNLFLHEINLSYTNLLDEHLISLIEFSPNLINIDISGCPKLTDKSVKILFEKLGFIFYFYIYIYFLFIFIFIF